MRLYPVGLVATLALVLLIPLASDAQQAMKVHRIGWLIAGSPPSGPEPRLDDLRQGLRDLGYVEGQNLLIEYRYAEGNAARLHDLAAELVRPQVDVIVAGGSAATRAAQQATRTIPIVMASSGNPVGLGFVASLPYGDATRTTWIASCKAPRRRTCPWSSPRSSNWSSTSRPPRPSGSHSPRRS